MRQSGPWGSLSKSWSRVGRNIENKAGKASKVEGEVADELYQELWKQRQNV